MIVHYFVLLSVYRIERTVGVGMLRLVCSDDFLWQDVLLGAMLLHDVLVGLPWGGVMQPLLIRDITDGSPKLPPRLLLWHYAALLHVHACMHACVESLIAVVCHMPAICH